MCARLGDEPDVVPTFGSGVVGSNEVASGQRPLIKLTQRSV